jgi:hypothetical protein
MQFILLPFVVVVVEIDFVDDDIIFRKKKKYY